MRFLLEEQLKDTPYPDMKLYEEIIFLKYWFKGKWVVENVKSYYEPLIKPFESGNHYFWSNFNINNRKPINRNIRGRGKIVNKWGFDLNKYSNKKIDMNRILNNLVNPKLALHIFNCAFKDKQHTLNGLSNTGGGLLYETETQ
jgi:DNA (cytosine-5)-methyltransferase 1